MGGLFKLFKENISDQNGIVLTIYWVCYVANSKLCQIKKNSESDVHGNMGKYDSL